MMPFLSIVGVIVTVTVSNISVLEKTNVHLPQSVHGLVFYLSPWSVSVDLLSFCARASRATKGNSAPSPYSSLSDGVFFLSGLFLSGVVSTVTVRS